MTIVEQHYDFDLKIDKVASFSKEDFNVAEKDWLLNEAQMVKVKTVFNVNNPYKRGFETLQKRIDDLSSLHVKYPDQEGVVPTSHPEGILEVSFSQLKYPYLHLTRAWADVEYTHCTEQTMLKFIQNDDLMYALRDPFNNSSKDFILYNIGRGESGTPSMYIYPDPDSIGIAKVYVEYVKLPRKVNYGNYQYIDGLIYPRTNCELPEHMHSEIVDTAVLIASGIIEHPSYYQLKKDKVFNNE